MIPAKPFYLIRHGETEANAARITAGGELDSPLTAQGRAQAQKVAGVIHQLEIKPTKVVHSPMSRARDTAHFINTALKLAMHEVHDLREHVVGEWEGKPWEEVIHLIHGNVRPKGGENKDDFGVRVRRVFTEVLDTHEDPVMIVAHGGIFHSLLHIHGWPYEGGIQNCHLHYFEPSPDCAPFPWRIWQFDIENDTLMRRSAPFCGTSRLAAAI